MIVEAIKKIVKRENLSRELTESVIEEIAAGKATDAQIAAFLTAIRIKGETVEEITAAATVMRKKCAHVNLGTNNIIDIVGTGGDGASTFNISTATAFVVAAGEVKVAKHGSRSASGKVGSADVLEALGVNIFTTPKDEERIFAKCGICFMLAPNHHPSMKFVAPARKEIGIRTFFNILGPLINPAGANMQLLGVFDKSLVEPCARVISNLGVSDAIVLHGLDGLDEATVLADTLICEVRNGTFKTYTINPREFGFLATCVDELKADGLEENTQILKDLFNNKITGAKLDIVLLNAALAFYCAKKTENIREGILLAKELLESGAVKEKFEEFKRETHGGQGF